jgi:hypothetical protein
MPQDIKVFHRNQQSRNAGRQDFLPLTLLNSMQRRFPLSPHQTYTRGSTPPPMSGSPMLPPSIYASASSIQNGWNRPSNAGTAVAEQPNGMGRGLSVREQQLQNEQQRLWNSAIEKKASLWLESWAFQQKTEGMIESLEDLDKLLLRVSIDSKSKLDEYETKVRTLTQRIDAMQVSSEKNWPSST